MTRTKTILRSQLPTVMSTPNDAAVLIQRVAQQLLVSGLSDTIKVGARSAVRRFRDRFPRRGDVRSDDIDLDDDE